MSAGFEKSVVVEDKGDGRFEVAYKGLAGQWQQLLGVFMFIGVAPISCIQLSSSNNADSSNLRFFLGIFIGIASFCAMFWLRSTKHEIEINSDGLKFSGKTVPYSEIDSVGCERNQVYIICSGTRVQLGDAQDTDIASAVIGKITKHSSVKFS